MTCTENDSVFWSTGRLTKVLYISWIQLMGISTAWLILTGTTVAWVTCGTALLFGILMMYVAIAIYSPGKEEIEKVGTDTKETFDHNEGQIEKFGHTQPFSQPIIIGRFLLEKSFDHMNHTFLDKSVKNL